MMAIYKFLIVSVLLLFVIQNGAEGRLLLHEDLSLRSTKSWWSSWFPSYQQYHTSPQAFEILPPYEDLQPHEAYAEAPRPFIYPPSKTGTFTQAKARALVLLPQPPPFSKLPAFQSHHLNCRPWQWMDKLTWNATQRCSFAANRCSRDSVCGAQLEAKRWRKWGNDVGSAGIILLVVMVAATMASLAVGVPMVGREGALVCGGQEGVWSQVKSQVLVSGRGGLRCGRVDLQGRSWRTGRGAAVRMCGMGVESGEVGKVGYGGQSGGTQPIQFEGGEDPPTVVYAPDRRIVAIGDLHGDIERTQWALQLAGVLSKDGQHRWTGGTTVLVQVGDVLDRGEDEIAILSLLAYLGKQARSKGGAVFQILGNHETMNVAGDFRYVAPGGFQEAETFAEYCEQDHGGNWNAAFEEWHFASQEFKKSRGVDFTGWLPIFNPIKIQKGVVARTKLLSPGGPLATQLAAHGVVLKVNDWLFAHGGVLPHHVDYGLERMNKEVSLWMKMGNNRWGQPAQMPFVAVKGFDSIVWSRLYSKENFDRPQEKIQVLHQCLVLRNIDVSLASLNQNALLSVLKLKLGWLDFREFGKKSCLHIAVGNWSFWLYLGYLMSCSKNIGGLLKSSLMVYQQKDELRLH
ncbi:hypothetical protein M758_5G152700 [Ceratodon purpureus]|nr:hypothetical protein M758_5G152700 [Ceratodon purpureus]